MGGNDAVDIEEMRYEILNGIHLTLVTDNCETLLVTAPNL